MSQNICIYFSDTGGGHRSAADALEAAIRIVIDESGTQGPPVSVIKESIAEKSHLLNRLFVEIYNYILRHHQPLMKYYYWFVNAVKPEAGFNLKLTEGYFCQVLATDQPSVVVAVHPMIPHCLAHAMKQLGLRDKSKLVVVVTDPNIALWRAWACPDADLIVVPNDVVARRLVQFGVAPGQIVKLGMPIHPDFLKPPSFERPKFLSHLGLASELLTVCINAGWAGGGNMLKIYRQLSKAKRQIQALILCGHNTALYEEAMANAAESDVPTAVLPFHDCMSDLMAAVDVMVTKAGGLTTYQALARRLPLIFDVITQPMPQERGTIDMLLEQKLAYAVYRPHDIIEIIESFQPHPDRYKQALPSAYDFNLTDGAVFDIGRKILECCTPKIVLSPTSDAEVSPCDWLQKSTVNRAAGET